MTPQIQASLVDEGMEMLCTIFFPDAFLPFTNPVGAIRLSIPVGLEIKCKPMNRCVPS